jgi:glutathione S-transferase
LPVLAPLPLVLFEKGMDFEIRDVDLFAKPEDIALMNPVQRECRSWSSAT